MTMRAGSRGLWDLIPISRYIVVKTGCKGTSNSATFRYNAIFHNAMQGLMFISDIDNEVNEIK